MIKNLIIISLLLIIIFGWSSDDFFMAVTKGLDFLQQIVYNVQSEVKNYE